MTRGRGPRRAWLIPALALLLASLAWVARDGMMVKLQLKVDGVVVEATVAELVEVQPAKSGPCRAAVYRFADMDGRERSGRVDCWRTTGLALQPGTMLTVTYLRHDPTIHRVGTFHDYALGRDLLVTLAVVGAGVLLLVLAGAAWERRRPRNGTDTQGT